MDPIKRISELAALIKLDTSVSQSQRSKAKSRISSLDNSSTDSELQLFESNGIDDLKKKIYERINSIEENDRSLEKVTMIFIETALSWQFGENIKNDPRFFTITREVIEDFKADQQLQKSLIKFLKQG